MNTSIADSSTASKTSTPGFYVSPISDRLLAFYGIVAAGLILLGLPHPLIAGFELGAWLILPGWVVVRRLPIADPFARLVWIGATSVVVAALAGLVMAWSGNWHPQPVAAGLLIAASTVVVFSQGKAVLHFPLASRRLHSLPRPKLGGLLPWLILGLAIILWGVGLAITDSSQLDDLGLLSKLPAIWFAAVALVLALSIWGLAKSRRASSSFMTALLTALVVMLYASASLLTSVPRLPWTYKHIAVTDFITDVGRVDPSIDIYNRWPGFFSASAFMGEAVGYPDALAYASWAEIGFAIVDVLIVLAIARSISKNPRVHWTAALVFTLTNWVGQNYYAPQAFTFTIYLVMCLTAFTFLRGAPTRAVRALERRLDRADPSTEETDPCVPGRAPRTTVIIAILILQAVVTASHQLTPYMAVLGLLPLFVLGFFKPRWVGAALMLIALSYLIPNLAYVEKSYGLFTGFDVFANASARLSTAPVVPDAAKWQEMGVRVLSGLTVVLALAGFVRHFRKGGVRTTLIVAWLSIAPAFTLLGQSYGGEGRLRVYLFALPWLSIGVAWLFWSGPIRRRRTVYGLTASLIAMAVLFTATYFQPESRYRVSESDVIAAKWLDSRVGNDDLTVLSAGAFPLLIGPHYSRYFQHGKLTSLEGLLDYYRNEVTAGDVEFYVHEAMQSAETAGKGKTYIIFSESQEKFVAQTGMLSDTVLPGIEEQLASEGATRKVFDNGAVQIYEYE